VLIALPVATPSEFINPPSYALGNFTNREYARGHFWTLRFLTYITLVSGYPSGFAFIMSWLAPVWTIGMSHNGLKTQLTHTLIGAYDSSVHISEEA
jgi:hypothetical protein